MDNRILAARLPVVVTAGRRASKSARELAVELYGAERVDEGGTLDGPMRTVDAVPSGDGTGPRPPGRR